MAVVAQEDYRQSLLQGLSAINVGVLLGLTDTVVNANGTVTLLIAAVRAFAPIAGAGPDALEAVARGLRLAQLAGAIPETTGVTTVATLRALVTANLPDVPSTYTGFLPQ